MTAAIPAPYNPAAANALAACQILDTPAEVTFDDLARRAADALKASAATISFFDAGGSTWREWFKSRVGFPEHALNEAECFYLPAIERAANLARIYVVNDMLADKRLREHRLVSGGPHFCFYAGAGIYAADRQLIGVLSVFDTSSREVPESDLNALLNLADLVGARLSARAEARRDRLVPTMPLQASARVDTRAEIARLEQRLEDEIASRQATETQLRDEKNFSDTAIDILPGVFFVFSKSGRMLRWNKNFSRVSGYTDAEIGNMQALDFVARDQRRAVEDAHRRLFEVGEDISMECQMLSKAGDSAPYTFQGRALDVAGYRFCLGVGRNISRRLWVAQNAAQAKERLDLALVGSNLAMWDWDLVNNQAYFNENWNTLIGLDLGGHVGTVFRNEDVAGWNHPDDKSRFYDAIMAAVKGQTQDFNCEYRVRGLNGDWIWLESNGKVTDRDPPEKGGRARRLTGTTANITKRRAAEDRVEYLATRDTLTGLPNRALFNDRLELGVANAARKQTQLAFMFIDLDRFKTINDSLGHDVGDELLKRVSARLSACVRASDTVARLGGDEFAVILENIPQGDQSSAQTIADKMIASLASPIMIDTHHLNTSCSIGISLFPADGTDLQTLMKHADVAMYDAKAKGRNNYQFFSHHLNARSQERLAIENYLRLALRRNELTLHYQPRVSFATGKVVGVEALLRWLHPRHGLLLPEKFLSVAEDSGLIVPIGEWVIEHATTQVATWRKKFATDLHLAVNLSPGQIYDGKRLVATIQEATESAGLPTTALELDLTESMLLKHADETASLLKRLGDMGVGLAIDDYGTGYSSLSYLRGLPVNAIKVDSSFVRDLGAASESDGDHAIIRAIIAMTHSLKLKVVAEGVETEAQHRLLRELQCDEYQGFYFAKPMPAAEFEAQFLAI